MAPKGPSGAQENAPLRGSPAWASFTAGGLGCQGAETTFRDATARALFPDSPAATCSPRPKQRVFHARYPRRYPSCPADLRLAADRLGGAVVADRLQRGKHPQPVRAYRGRVPLPDHRAALRPIRNVMPNLGGIDISPVILILL